MIDLHTHSHFSDGELSPTGLIYKAKKAGISHLAITDHDTLGGLDEGQKAAIDCGIGFINGIELTACWRQYDLHILGLGFDKKHPALNALVVQQKKARDDRAYAISDALLEMGVENAYEGAMQYAPKGDLTRPHFAKYLVEIGKASDMKRAFKDHLGRGKVAYVRANWASLETVVKVIKEASGLAIIAHPAVYGFTRMKLGELIEDFMAVGGDGLEVITGCTTEKNRNLLQSLCHRYDLLASIGSDYHGSFSKQACFGKLADLPVTLKGVWQALGIT